DENGSVTIERTRALIPDPRNDENLIISQLHLAFLRYHNAVADTIERICREQVTEPKQPDEKPDRGWRFQETQRVVRWHYQWSVVHEFLRGVVGEEIVKDVLDKHRGDDATANATAKSPAGMTMPRSEGEESAERSWLGTYRIRYLDDRGEELEERALSF